MDKEGCVFKGKLKRIVVGIVSGYLMTVLALEEPRPVKLENEIAEARVVVQEAEIALREAKASLAELGSQKPLQVGNNEAAIESQLYTYQLTVDTRRQAVQQAEWNLQKARQELQAAQEAYHRGPKP